MDFVANATKQIESEGSFVLYGGYLNIKKCFGIKKKLISIITEKNLFLFSSDSSKILHAFDILDIEHITFGPRAIYIEILKANFTLIPDEIDEFTAKLSFVLEHLLASNELDMITNNNNSLVQLVSKPSSFGAFCRFLTCIQKNEYPLSNADLEKLKYALICRRSRIDFSSFNNPVNALKLFLKVAPLCNSFNYICVHQTPENDIFSILNQNFFKEINYIKILSINSEKSSSFSDFIRNLKDDEQTKLKGISFTKSKFDNNDLQQLSDCIVAKSLTSLELNDAVQADSIPYMINVFLPSLQNKSSLNSLSINNIPSIKIKNLLDSTINIRVLSVVNCGLYINDFFSYLSAMPNHKVTSLNLSKNYLRPTQEIFSIHNSIHTVIIDDTIFRDSSFVWLLNFLLRNLKDESSLSICGAEASDAEWKAVDLFLKRTSSAHHLKSLKWDGNELSDGFFVFLNQQGSNLEELSLSGCFNNNHFIDSLAKFLRNAKHLTKFICKRYKQKQLGKLTKEISYALKYSKSLKYIDISNSFGGDECYEKLYYLLETLPNLEILVYDGLKPQSKDKIKEFITKVSRNDYETVASFPLHDIEYLHQEHLLTSEEIFNLLELSVIKCNDDYMRPFSVFYDEHQATSLFADILNTNKLDMIHAEKLHFKKQRIASIDDSLSAKRNSSSMISDNISLSNNENENPNKNKIIFPLNLSPYNKLFLSDKTSTICLSNNESDDDETPRTLPSSTHLSASPVDIEPALIQTFSGERKLQIERPPPIDVSFIEHVVYESNHYDESHEDSVHQKPDKKRSIRNLKNNNLNGNKSKTHSPSQIQKQKGNSKKISSKKLIKKAAKKKGNQSINQVNSNTKKSIEPVESNHIINEVKQENEKISQMKNVKKRAPIRNMSRKKINTGEFNLVAQPRRKNRNISKQGRSISPPNISNSSNVVKRSRSKSIPKTKISLVNENVKYDEKNISFKNGNSNTKNRHSHQISRTANKSYNKNNFSNTYSHYSTQESIKSSTRNTSSFSSSKIKNYEDNASINNSSKFQSPDKLQKSSQNQNVKIKRSSKVVSITSSSSNSISSLDTISESLISSKLSSVAPVSNEFDIYEQKNKNYTNLKEKNTTISPNRSNKKLRKKKIVKKKRTAIKRSKTPEKSSNARTRSIDKNVPSNFIKTKRTNATKNRTRSKNTSQVIEQRTKNSNGEMKRHHPNIKDLMNQDLDLSSNSTKMRQRIIDNTSKLKPEVKQKIKQYVIFSSYSYESSD